MCEKPSQPMIRLRGLCRDSALQNLFTPVSDEKGRLMYVGLSMTNIVYNETTFLWVATNMGYHDLVATNSASAASGLLGTTPCYKQFLLGLEEPEKSADAEKSEILR